jgi:hypothetical protein
MVIRSPARPAIRAGGAGQSALLLTLPFLPQAAAPAAPWAVPSVPRAVSAKRHLTSAAAVPEEEHSCSHV